MIERSLKHEVIHGLKWSLLAKLFTQLFSWAATFMVIRWLTPADYGIVGLSMIFFVLISMFTTNGLTSAIVREQQRGGADHQMFTLSLLLNLCLSGALALMAPWISAMMGSPQIKEVLWVLAAANPITSFAVVPSAHLQMEMKFKEKAIAESVAGLVAAASSLAMAYAGMGYWSLIFSGILMVWVRILILNLQSRSDFRVIVSPEKWRGAKERFVFSFQIQLGTLLWFCHAQADMLIVGKMLGVEKAGSYTVASDIASIPMTKVSSIINDVAFSAFNKIKHDIGLAKKHAQTAMRCIGAVVFPVFFGLSVVSGEVVQILLGDKWREAGVVMGIMCLGFPFKMVNSVLSNYATGIGNSRHGLIMSFYTLFIMVSCLLVGTAFGGLSGAAYGWLTGTLASILLNKIRVAQIFGFNAQQLMVYWPALATASIMWGVVYLVDHHLLRFFPDNQPLVLLIKITVGAMVSAPPLWFLYAQEIKQMMRR